MSAVTPEVGSFFGCEQYAFMTKGFIRERITNYLDFPTIRALVLVEDTLVQKLEGYEYTGTGTVIAPLIFIDTVL